MIQQFRCTDCKRLLVKCDIDIETGKCVVLYKDNFCRFEKGKMVCTKCGRNLEMKIGGLVHGTAR